MLNKDRPSAILNSYDYIVVDTSSPDSKGGLKRGDSKTQLSTRVRKRLTCIAIAAVMLIAILSTVIIVGIFTYNSDEYPNAECQDEKCPIPECPSTEFSDTEFPSTECPIAVCPDEVCPEKICPIAESTDEKSPDKKCPEKEYPTTEYSSKECLNEECLYSAYAIKKNMDKNIDPCNDFYEFACGRFIGSSVDPSKTIRRDTFSQIRDQLLQQLRNSVNKPIRDSEPKPFRLVKEMYKSCTNKRKMNKLGAKPLLQALKEYGGWPVLEGNSWNKSTLDIKIWDGFVDIDVDVDLRNTSNRVIYIAQPLLSLPREYFREPDYLLELKTYIEYMADTAENVGANKSNANTEMLEAAKLEIRLADISIPIESIIDLDMVYNPTTLKDFMLNSSIPLKQIIGNKLPPEMQPSDDEKIIVLTPSYFNQLENVLKMFSLRTLANYGLWEFVYLTAKYLDDEIRAQQLKFMSLIDINESREEEDRWKECLSLIIAQIPIGINAMYVRDYFSKDAKKEAIEILNDIKQEFTKMFEKSYWIDEISKQNALDKLASMTSNVAYPDEFLDDSKINEYYEELEFSNDTFFENILSLAAFNEKITFKQLKIAINASDWTFHSQSAYVNAFYSNTENRINFPAAILQGSIFNKNRPQYMNYGTFGSIAGHEITHGFDNSEQTFDHNGEMTKIWTPKTRNNFSDRAECIKDQYKNYTTNGNRKKLIPELTLNEDIADNVGAKVAYSAYLEYIKRNGSEFILPGLNSTTKQLFWISFANIWCNEFKSDYYKILMMNKDNHSPGEFRVRGTLANLEEFAEDFNCPVGSKMNPGKKCAIF